jgi:hypothetical protein
LPLFQDAFLSASSKYDHRPKIGILGAKGG